TGMRAGAVEEPEEEEAAHTSDEQDVPDWLKELRGPAAAREPARPAPETPDIPEADVPDWLTGMRAGAVEEPEEEEAAHTSDEQDVPDWLKELRGPAAAREPARPARETPDIPEADVPDWLAGMRAGAIEEPEEEEAARADDEQALPDWLKELRAPKEKEHAAPPESEVPPERPVPGAPRVEEAAVPAWLAALRPTPEDEPPPPPSPRGARRREEADEGQTPDWLPSPSSSERDEPERAGLQFEAEASGDESSDWLAELRMQRREAERELEEEEFEYSTGDIPDWLVPSDGGFEEETLARADIPEWLLALKPAALRAEGEPEGPSVLIEAPVEETGILAGLQGTLPVEMLIAQPRAVKPSAVVEAPVTDTPNARLFAEIVGRPVESAPKELAQPRRRLLSLLPRWLLYIALIGVVALPLVAGQPLVPRDVEAALPVQSLYDRVSDLDEDSLVLVAFDYDPTSSGEMDLLARALVGSVMDRGARVIVVSTLPAGPATAQRVLDDLAAERPPYAGRYGERYANLGYIPGQAAGVRLLSQSLPLALVHDFNATPLGEMPVLDNVVSAADLDLVLELAATQEPLRWWIEQAGAPYGVSIAAGTSGAVEPFARAYYQADPPQLAGLVSGVPGAVSYEMVATGQVVPDDRLAARLDSQLGGHLIFIAVLLVGGVMGLLRRDMGKEA
ncbi:MAG TPA: hypothetical protein VLC95_19425, partial [Anaerolineae bacterium]|nr:hypothetical protein [Anaerolineae bacterium]